METFSINLSGSSIHEVYNIVPLSDNELAKTYRFSISFRSECDGIRREETVSNLSITHRIFELATIGPSGRNESASGTSTITADPAALPASLKAPPKDDEEPQKTGFVLASNISASDDKTYILWDPENEIARNIRSKDKVLGDRKLVLISSQPLSLNVSKQSISSRNKHMHAKRYRLTGFRPELSYVAGLNAIWECRLALSNLKLSYDWSDNAIDPVAAALIEKGISSWNALFYSATQLCDNNPSTPFDNVDIYSIVNRKEKLEGVMGCSTDARHYHLRLAFRSMAAFQSETTFRINHCKNYTLAPLPMYSIFSTGEALPNVFVVHRELQLDDSTIEATTLHEPLGKIPTVLGGDAPDEAEAEVEHEIDETMNEVVWGSDHVTGLRDEVSGVATFRHERSAEIYRGIPRAQIVREGYRSGFVVVSETEGNKRTLAVRDHNLLHAIYNEAAEEEGEEFIPVILPLVGRDMHAIFGLTCSENGDGIVASPLGD